jgi:hypothetical protein
MYRLSYIIHQHKWDVCAWQIWRTHMKHKIQQTECPICHTHIKKYILLLQNRRYYEEDWPCRKGHTMNIKATFYTYSYWEFQHVNRLVMVIVIITCRPYLYDAVCNQVKYMVVCGMCYGGLTVCMGYCRYISFSCAHVSIRRQRRRRR